MNRNTELHFGNTPSIDLKRSKFDMSHSIKTTQNTGDIVPVEVIEVLPGDTAQLDMAELVRMATPLYPIMDNLYLDLYCFFVPTRLLWDHWKAFWGENNDPWTQTTPYEVPQIEAPAGGWTEGTMADYMGIPTKVGNISVNAMPFRGYVQIYNDWFRDENNQYAVHMYTDETTRTGKNGTEVGYDPVTDTELGGKLLKAAKFHDYYTSALPSAQKGNPVTIPITGQATVKTANSEILTAGESSGGILFKTINGLGKLEDVTQDSGSNGRLDYLGLYKGDAEYTGRGKNIQGVDWKAGQSTSQLKQEIAPVNLYADLGTITATTITQLRTAFAIQKYYENAGLHGTRYIEYLRGVFGVTSSDARLQRAEYLGGTRVPINIDQIIQTSSTDTTTPQGNASGFSCTFNKDSLFTKSFEEHGFLYVLSVIRTDHTYQQGLEKMWTRKKWVDYYNPFFANLSEMPILCENIYAQGSTVVDSDGNEVDKKAFGYQEAWAEYRYCNNRVTGYMRSNATGSLDVWHFADDYNSLPQLGNDWIQEPQTNVDRTIAVSSQIAHQFISDYFLKLYMTREMPVYSVPGLVDHV